MASDTHFEVNDPPSDGITRVKFLNHSNRLLVSSWDKSVTLHDINAPKTSLLQSYEHKAGVLDVTTTDDDLHAFSGGCDYALMQCDLKTGQARTIGNHNQPIRCVEYCDERHIVATGES